MHLLSTKKWMIEYLNNIIPFTHNKLTAHLSNNIYETSLYNWKKKEINEKSYIILGDETFSYITRYWYNKSALMQVWVNVT